MSKFWSTTYGMNFRSHSLPLYLRNNCCYSPGTEHNCLDTHCTNPRRMARLSWPGGWLHNEINFLHMFTHRITKQASYTVSTSIETYALPQSQRRGFGQPWLSSWLRSHVRALTCNVCLCRTTTGRWCAVCFLCGMKKSVIMKQTKLRSLTDH